MRIWFQAPYEGSFESSLENMLSTRELLALPGREGRLRVTPHPQLQGRSTGKQRST